MKEWEQFLESNTAIQEERSPGISNVDAYSMINDFVSASDEIDENTREKLLAALAQAFGPGGKCDVALDMAENFIGWLGNELSVLSESWNSYLAETDPGFLEGSVYKDVLYHGSDHDFKIGDNFDTEIWTEEPGIYLTPKHRYARMYGDNLYRVMVNIKNPLYVMSKSEAIGGDVIKQGDIEALQSQGYDSIVVTNGDIKSADEIVVFNSDNVRITGKS